MPAVQVNIATGRKFLNEMYSNNILNNKEIIFF